MKIEVIICDICGKPINYNEHRKFKAKMKEFYCTRNPFEKSQWLKINVHDECFKEFGRLISSAREQREKDFDELLKNINAFAEVANKSLL